MSDAHYLRPSSFDILINKLMGKLATWGIGPSYIYQLGVRGRKSGKLYSTPVNMMDVDGVEYLVAPRGTTSWVRNARVVGEIELKRGNRAQRFKLEELSDAEKLPILKEYLDRYKREVQRYFTVKAGSSEEAFVDVAETYPVFRLIEDN